MADAVRKVVISNPGKVLFPEPGYTKEELVVYYEKVSAYLLPFLKNRPVMLHRFPQGIGKEGFYQKEISAGFPEWIARVTVPRENQTPIEQAVINTKAALRFLVN